MSASGTCILLTSEKLAKSGTVASLIQRQIWGGYVLVSMGLTRAKRVYCPSYLTSDNSCSNQSPQRIHNRQFILTFATHAISTTTTRIIAVPMTTA